MATQLVTRKVVTARKYDIYKIQKGKMELLERGTYEERPVKKDVASLYELKTTEVFIECTGTVKTTYGVPVEKFMEIAEVVATEDGESDEE